MKSSFTIQEMDFILHILMQKYKNSKDEHKRKCLRKFIKSFDSFYAEADEFTDKQKVRGEVLCEIDPWLITEG